MLVKNSTFKTRQHNGEMHEIEQKEYNRMKNMWDQDKNWFTLSPNNIKMKENHL